MSRQHPGRSRHRLDQISRRFHPNSRRLHRNSRRLLLLIRSRGALPAVAAVAATAAAGAVQRSRRQSRPCRRALSHSHRDYPAELFAKRAAVIGEAARRIVVEASLSRRPSKSSPPRRHSICWGCPPHVFLAPVTTGLRFPLRLRVGGAVNGTSGSALLAWC